MNKNLNGWVILNKPTGISSNNAMTLVRRALGVKKTGHAGTLDPLASGVLPIAVGEATKVISYAMDHEKTYIFTIAWGEERTTDDLEGEVLYQSDVRPTVEEIHAILPQFQGNITQVPPIYSAIKVQGKRACDYARSGENITLPPRNVCVKNLHLLSFLPHEASFQMVCSKGTYVRSLARDMARSLGTYGHVTALRRTAVGSFLEKDSILLDKLVNLSHNLEESSYLYPLTMVLDDIPAVILNDEDMKSFRQGRRPLLRDVSVHSNTKVLCVDTNKSPVGLGSILDGFIQPVRVFNL